MNSLYNKLLVIICLGILAVSGILCSKMPDPLNGWGNKVSVSTGSFQVPTSTSVVISNNSITCKTDPLVGKERGICWSDSAANVTIQKNKIPSGSGTGNFNTTLNTLSPAKTYYYRGYVIISQPSMVIYGEVKSFTTPASCPVISTNTTTSITSTSAILGGNITATGGAPVTARGVVYSSSSTTPTIGGIGVTNSSSGTGIGAYSVSATALIPGTTYYVRAYATNSAGTCYGSTLSFITVPIVCPTLTTTAASSVTTTTSIVGGSVSADGGAPVTARGVVYSSTNTLPAIGGAGVTNALGGSGVGAYNIGLSALVPGTTYYMRAYATNSAGTCYGALLSFATINPVVCPTLSTTAASLVTTTTATIGGNITADGGAAVTVRGVVFSTSNTNPTVGGAGVINAAAGSGTGGYGIAISNLLPGTTYYIRAYATNSAGTCYGATLTFTTLNPAVCPTVSTASATGVTQRNAILGGNVTADGGANVVERGVVYSSTNVNPTIGAVGVTRTPIGFGIGNFSGLIAGIFTPATTYYVRAYATNSAGTCYGQTLSFTTLPVVCPTVTTTAASAVTATSATLGGNVTVDGGAAVTARGIVISNSNTNPVIGGVGVTNVAGGSGIGAYALGVGGLLPGVTYYVRAYATNSSGTCYGAILSFRTGSLAVLCPTLTTTAASLITATTATLGGNVTADGGAPVTARGVVVSSTNSSPTVGGVGVSNLGGGTGVGAFSISVSGFTPGTLYWIRSYATNSAGTCYGATLSFVTSNVAVVCPTVITDPIANLTSTSVTLNGNVTADGGAAVTDKGILITSTTTTPTLGAPGVFVASAGAGVGLYGFNVTGLTPRTTYYIRSYATNSAGTCYGVIRTFITP